jgi:hypothetical protein
MVSGRDYDGLIEVHLLKSYLTQLVLEGGRNCMEF